MPGVVFGVFKRQIHVVLNLDNVLRGNVFVVVTIVLLRVYAGEKDLGVRAVFLRSLAELCFDASVEFFSTHVPSL